jgi:ferritin-like metal-binding protein YciE
LSWRAESKYAALFLFNRRFRRKLCDPNVQFTLLATGFEAHLKQTEGHVGRLEKIMKSLDESPKGKKCKGMEGLIKEGAELIEEDPGDEELDAGLISAAQRVEHYEMAGYGCVATYAKLLGEDQAETLLRQTLDEEKETDKKLTQLAQHINVEAMNSEGAEAATSSLVLTHVPANPATRIQIPSSRHGLRRIGNLELRCAG